MYTIYYNISENVLSYYHLVSCLLIYRTLLEPFPVISDAEWASLKVPFIGLTMSNNF